MRFDCIIANPPYAKIGCDITRKVIENNPDSNYAMLGTRSMFRPFYADILACQFVQIGQYELGTNKKLDWGVEQAILLATNGWTEVVDNRKKEGDYKAGAPEAIARQAWNHRTRSSHLVGVGSVRLDKAAFTDYRTSHLVGIGEASKKRHGYSDLRTSTVTEQKLRNGYIYVAFDTFEEACECAIDIISWTDPTDSHYRCVRWGFVCGLVPHYKNGF
jgi:hypothetical protein